MKLRLIIGIAALVLAAPVAANAAKPVPTQTLTGTLIDWSIVHGNVQGTVVDANGQPNRFVMPPASLPKALDIGRILRLQGALTTDMAGVSTFKAAKTATPLGLNEDVVVRRAAVSNVGQEAVTLAARSGAGMVNMGGIAYDPSFFSALQALRAGDNTPSLTHVFELRLLSDEWTLASF
jgi:hypothetical protein